MTRLRLHKYLATAGVGSRRHCEELIEQGRVTVDGEEVRSMGLLVDPDKQEIRFDDERVVAEPPAYYAVWKPPGYLCTNHDPQGRRTVISLVRDKRRRRLYTVGRLDEDSEGLIIVTNDGEFSNLVAHPRYGLEKTYQLKLRGSMSPESLERVRKGVWLSTGKTGSMFCRIDKRTKQFTQVTASIQEGKNRQLRRVFANVGHAVLKLRRVRIGSLTLQGLKRGEARVLRPDEVADLLERCEQNRKGGGRSAPRTRRDVDSERWGGENKGRARKNRRKEARSRGRRDSGGRSRGR